MPKGYWMALVTIKNPERYKDYIAANGVAFSKYEARFIVRGGKAETMAGPRRDRHVVIEFPSLQAALDCYHSPEYQAAKKIFDEAATTDMTIVEGVA